MASNNLTDIATRHQVMLERYKSGKVRDYLTITQKMEGDILAEFIKLRVDTLDQLAKKELNKLIVRVRKIINSYDVLVAEDLFSDMRDLSRSEVGAEVRVLNRVLKEDGIRIDAQPTVDTAWTEVRVQPITANGQLTDVFFKDWDATRKAQVIGAIRNGYKEGLTLQQLTQRVRGTRANKFKDGLTNLQTRQAEALIRTEVQHVSSSARIKTFKDNKDVVDGYVWVSTLDSRTTQICRSLDGQEFKTGQGPVPPIHIGCRSTMRAKVRKDLGLDFLREGGTRASVKGPVSNQQTYYTWLKTQPREFQNMAIGNGMAKILNDGTLTADQFRKISVTKTFKPLTLAEMQDAQAKFLLTN